MKKIVSVAFVFVLMLALVACGGGQKPDGVYTAQVDAAFAENNHGWTDTLTVTYENGVVVDAVFESYDAEGNKKSESTPDTYPMEPAPTEWMPQLSQMVVDAGTSDKMDVIAGATHSSDSAKLLFAAIEKDGKAGETITVTMPAAEE